MSQSENSTTTSVKPVPYSLSEDELTSDLRTSRKRVYAFKLYLLLKCTGQYANLTISDFSVENAGKFLHDYCNVLGYNKTVSRKDKKTGLVTEKQILKFTKITPKPEVKEKLSVWLKHCVNEDRKRGSEKKSKKFDRLITRVERSLENIKSTFSFLMMVYLDPTMFTYKHKDTL
eukprot:1654383-Rhodomonas_salina.3